MRRTLLIISFIFIISSALPLLAQSESRVWQDILYSDALGSMKTFQIYLPEGYDESNERYPTVYFLHQKDFNWFKPWLYSHGSKSLKHIADSLIDNRQIGKMILVDPDLGDCSMAIPGMPNMLRPDLTNKDGIGSGQFEDYLINDLIPYIDAHYRTKADRSRRGIDGFGFSGYAAVLSAIKHPELFSSAGSYQAPFMWENLDDPMHDGIRDDSLWLSTESDSIFSPTFDVPRNINYMLKNNPINLIKDADDATLENIRSIRFHIQAANPNNFDVYETSKANGYQARNAQFIKTLSSYNILNTFDDYNLTNANNDWPSALLHAAQSLTKHWDSFQEKITSLTEKSPIADNVVLSQNYPNPFNPSTMIPYSLKQASKIKVDVLNILGQTVSTLINETRPAGSYQLIFDATDLPSGTYFYRIEADHYSKIKKMVLVK